MSCAVASLPATCGNAQFIEGSHAFAVFAVVFLIVVALAMIGAWFCR